MRSRTRGQATLSLPASSYRFAVYEADNSFYSGAVGHCVTPSCTTASIAVNRVDVTVVDTNGTPQVGQEVFWENSATDGGFLNTNASGHVLMAVPPGSYWFGAIQHGQVFTSGTTFHCNVPSCTTATITVTLPVTVTVRDSNNAPQSNLQVKWESSQTDGSSQTTDADGVAIVSTPQGAFKFIVTVAGTVFESGASFHCVVPAVRRPASRSARRPS